MAGAAIGPGVVVDLTRWKNVGEIRPPSATTPAPTPAPSTGNNSTGDETADGTTNSSSNDDTTEAA